MGRPKMYDDALRERLIFEAGKMLSDGGYHSVSLRTLTKNANTSTNAVYTLFGSKEALMAEVIIRDLDNRLGRDFDDYQSEDPTSDLVYLARYYRNLALDDPKVFDGMFLAIADASKNQRRPERASADILSLDARIFNPLLTTCQRLVDAGLVRDIQPKRMAMGVWAVIHGYITLEVKELFDTTAEENDAIFLESLYAMYLGWTSNNVSALHESFTKERVLV